VTLKRQATAGVFWVGVTTAIKDVFLQLTKYVLARMLFPADFGLVSMAYLAIDFLEMFSDAGFTAAMVYRKGDVRKAADTTFAIGLIIAAVLFSVVFFGAPTVAVFFRTPQLTLVLRVLSINIIIFAFGQVHMALLVKNLAFREKMVPDLVSVVGNGVVSIAFALMGYGVWSLVIGKIVGTALTTVLAWIVVPWWRPRLRIDRKEAKELLGYGRHIVGSGVLIWLITNLDNTFVGRVLGEEQLGLYGFAYTQANLPATQISRIVGQVLFPAFSKIRDDAQALRGVFFRSMRYVSLASVPVSIGMIAFAKPFILTLYGGKWAQAIVPLQLLGVYGLVRAVAVNLGNMFKAGGKPQWLTYLAFVRMAEMGIFLYPAVRYYGIIGVSVLSAAVSIVDFVISLVLTNQIVHGRLGDYMRAVGFPVALSLVVTLVGLGAYSRMSSAHSLIALLVTAALMVALYGLLVMLLDPDVRKIVLGLLAQLEQAGRGSLDE
jgi:O-antigen/teichoic acid export membrane protein